MDLIGLIKLMLRHWLVVVPMLLLTVAIGASVHRGADSLYAARGSVLLTSNPVDGTAAPQDVLDIGEIAEVVRLSDQARSLVEFDERASFTIAPTADNVMEVTLVGGASEEVSSAVMGVAQLVIDRIEEVQADAGVAPDERVVGVVISEPVVPVARTLDDETVFEATVGVLLDDKAASRANPYEANRATSRLVQVALQSDAGRSQVAETSSEGIAFSITHDINDPAPILDLSVYGNSPAEALAGFDGLVGTMQDYLDGRQQLARVPHSSRISIEVIAQPVAVENVSPPVSRAAAAALALGIILAMVSAVMLENLAARRRLSSGAPQAWLTEADAEGNGSVNARLGLSARSHAQESPRD